jgi:hypothetical protein
MSSIAMQTGTSQVGNLLQFLAWVGERPRTYADTMDAWRTTCPRLSAWEDATADGLVGMSRTPGDTLATALVVLTPKGAALLDEH